MLKMYHWQLEFKESPPWYYFETVVILFSNNLLLAYIPLKNIQFIFHINNQL